MEEPRTQDDDLPLADRVRGVIDREIRPYIAMDGGTIDYIDIRDGVLYVALSGACHSCPSSTMTLKGSVERIIRRRFPEIQAVRLAGVSLALDEE
jgi:Fe-S cluster biogenesis protein NfuA